MEGCSFSVATGNNGSFLRCARVTTSLQEDIQRLVQHAQICRIKLCYKYWNYLDQQGK